jgi:hypothetical protein
LPQGTVSGFFVFVHQNSLSTVHYNPPKASQHTEFINLKRVVFFLDALLPNAHGEPRLEAGAQRTL